jgi:hypothetical protein
MLVHVVFPAQGAQVACVVSPSRAAALDVGRLRSPVAPGHTALLFPAKFQHFWVAFSFLLWHFALSPHLPEL